MAKRGGSELTHDNWDQEEEREDAGTFKKATEGDMKGRVIKRARRRNAGGEEGEKKNVFAGFGGFAAKPDATQAFSFLSKPAEPEKPAGGFVFGAAAVGGGGTTTPSSKPAASAGFSFGSTNTGPPKPTFGGFAAESKAEVSAPVFGSFTSDKSNSSPSNPPLFGSKSDSVPAATFGGFSFGTKKDATPEPAKKVEDPPAVKSDFSSFKQAAGWSCSTCMVNNPVDKTSCLACETPKPGTKPVEKTVPAPAFGSGGGFKFGGDSAAKTDSGSTAGLFSFGSAGKSTEGAKSSEEKSGGGFSFGAKASTDKPAGGGFSFGAKADSPDKQPAATGFSFGAVSDSSSSKATTGFSFGAKSDSTEKPIGGGFAFGAKSDSSNKPVGGGFSLGAKPVSSEEPPAATGSFSFGSKPQSDTATAAPSSSKPSSSVKPTTSSTATNSDTTSGFSTEYLSHLKALNIQVLAWLKQHIESNPLVILSPVFKDYDTHLAEITSQYDKEKTQPKAAITASEGSSSSTTTTVPDTAPKADIKPLGQAAFGAPKTSASSSPFSFGSSDKPVNSTAPFSFGQTSQPAPSSGFGTSGGFAAAGAFSFGAGGLANTNTTTTTTKQNEEEDEDQPPVVEVKQVEESDAIYDKKCKLFYKKDGNYVEKGVGMLYLKTVEGGKTQLLVRADTNLGNVLLNILLSPQIPTTRVGKNNVMLVCVPNPPVDPKADSSAPCPMLIRVKTGDDADELKAKLDELKEK